MLTVTMMIIRTPQPTDLLYPIHVDLQEGLYLYEIKIKLGHHRMVKNGSWE